MVEKLAKQQKELENKRQEYQTALNDTLKEQTSSKNQLEQELQDNEVLLKNSRGRTATRIIAKSTTARVIGTIKFGAVIINRRRD